MDKATYRLLIVKLRCAAIVPKYVWWTDARLHIQFRTYQKAVAFAQYVHKGHRGALLFATSSEEMTLAHFVLAEGENKWADDATLSTPLDTSGEFVRTLKTPSGPILPSIHEHPTLETLARQTRPFTQVRGVFESKHDYIDLIRTLIGESAIACGRQQQIRVVTLIFDVFTHEGASIVWKAHPSVRCTLWHMKSRFYNDLRGSTDPVEVLLKSLIDTTMTKIACWCCDSTHTYVSYAAMLGTLGYDVGPCVVGLMIDAQVRCCRRTVE